MHTDYLIIGQGISGTLLSWRLLASGCKVIVADELRPSAASRVAAGLVNPVTGLRFAENKDFDELWAYAGAAYASLGHMLGQPLVGSPGMFIFPQSVAEEAAITARVAAGSRWLQPVAPGNDHTAYFNSLLHPWYNGGARRIHIGSLLSGWRQYLSAHGLMVQQPVTPASLQFTATGATCQGIQAGMVILADGAATLRTHYFPWLRFRDNKAQVVTARISGLPRTHMYKGPYTIVPWQDDEFWIGASFERDFTDPYPTPGFAAAVQAELSGWLRLPLTITGHMASVRAASIDYQPFVGISPAQPRLGIFNGFGSKALSYAPYCAHQFVQHLLTGAPLSSAISIARFGSAAS